MLRLNSIAESVPEKDRKISTLREQIAALEIELEGSSKYENENKRLREQNEALQKQLAERQTNNSRSAILNENAIWNEVLMSWLDGRSFGLLYRASRDGWRSGDFHRCCDNRGPTLVVARCSNGFVFGGYAAAAWNSNGGCFQSAANASFVFTLKNPHNIPPTRYSCKNPANELYGHSNYGPTIGGSDLLVADQANANNHSQCHLGYSYNDTTGLAERTFTGNKHFYVAEYEVFALQ